MNYASYTHMKSVGSMVDRYGGPMGLAGKLIGLGKEEMASGVPGWAWFTVGALMGGVATYAMRSKIERIVG